MSNESTGPAAPREMPPLTDAQRHVIVERGTEMPGSGAYDDHDEAGTYLCRQCGAALYESTSKFHSGCGWPSFDDEIDGAVKRIPDADGQRTEIVCAACDGHLGHVFEGEGFTDANTRHCVNSVSMVFVPAAQATPGRAIFAGGCFWGVEHHFQQIDGVESVVSGYIGGDVDSPSYEEVCRGRTGHAEAVEVRFDPSRVTYEQLARAFFEIHDPTQVDRQGPDVGTQYRSAVFYLDDAQKAWAEALIAELTELGYDVATKVVPAGTFWAAEDYHQDYIEKHPDRYCHARVARFDTPAGE